MSAWKAYQHVPSPAWYANPSAQPPVSATSPLREAMVPGPVVVSLVLQRSRGSSAASTDVLTESNDWSSVVMKALLAASTAVRRSAWAARSWALVRAAEKEGAAIPMMMAMMATTTISSRMVNPSSG